MCSHSFVFTVVIWEAKFDLKYLDSVGFKHLEQTNSYLKLDKKSENTIQSNSISLIFLPF